MAHFAEHMLMLGGLPFGATPVIISAKLFRTLQDTLGDAADELVNWIHRVDESRSELRELNDLSFARVDSRFNEHRHWTEAQFSEFRRTVGADLAELRQGLSDVRGELKELRGGLTDVRGELKELRGGLTDVRGELKELRDGLSEVRGDQRELREVTLPGLREQIHTLDGALRTEIARSEARLLKWSFAFWVTAILTIIGLA
jgi:septation ring formation regulator EzrA